MGKILGLVLGFLVQGPIAMAVEVVTETPHASCERIELHRPLKVFKDPTLFLPAIALLYSDPIAGWKQLGEERPLLTTLTGGAELMRLGPPRKFKNFISIAAVTRMYERAEPRLQELSPKEKEDNAVNIIPIKLCGGPNAPYADTLGFVLERDLKLAQQIEERKPGSSLPPSVYPNQIPNYP